MKVLIFIIMPLLLFGQVITTEGFEGTGAPTNWASSGTVDWDATDVVLTGVQSCKINSDLAIAQYQPTVAADEFYVFFQFKPTAVATTGSRNLLLFYSSTSAVQASVYINASKIQIGHGTSIATGSTTLIAETKYYLWCYWVKGTGSDGVINVHLSTTKTKPASPEVSIINGSTTLQTNRIRLYAAAQTMPVWFDEFVLSSAEIGDYDDGTTTKKDFGNYGGWGGWTK